MPMPASQVSRYTALRWGAVVLGLVFFHLAAHANAVQVAVAANFAEPAEKIAAQFERDTGHKAVISIGSTGKFYAQIKNGAPFDVLLAADQSTPQKLQVDGRIVEGQRFTYATGRLVLYSVQPTLVDKEGKILESGSFGHLALANPQTAPYGAAAVEVLMSLGLMNKLRPRIVQGDSIGQTFEFVATGNAELGFVALSQVAPPGKTVVGSWWVVPQSLYQPILQDAVLLKFGADNPAARSFLDYLRTEKAKSLIRSFGYSI